MENAHPISKLAGCFGERIECVQTEKRTGLDMVHQKLKEANQSITKEAFTRVLMGSFQDGGLEFSAERANEAARKVESVMNMAREVRQYRKRLQEKYTSPKQMERLHRIRDSVLRESGMHVGEVQMKLLDENVASRVAGFLSMEDFRDRLSAPHKDDAACFSSRDARTLSHHLEKVIAQGVHL